MFNLFKKSARSQPLQSSTLTAASDAFIWAHIKAELSSIVDDLLECYIFQKIGLDAVYPVAESNVRTASLTIRDILINAFCGQKQTIAKIRLSTSLTSVVLLVDRQPDAHGCIDFGSYGHIRPEKYLVFEHIFDPQTLVLLQSCFSLLWDIYQRLERRKHLDQKVIFKMHGFHALFTEPKNQEESYIAAENRRLLRENLQDILDGQGGIIDAQDSLGLFNATQQSLKHQFAEIDIIYAEIARLLKVPLTRLIGRSPQGFNATGASDRLDYDLTLDRYRSGWLEPFLLQMHIPYQKVAKIDIDYLHKILQMHTLCQIDPDPILVEKIRTLGVSL